MELSFEMSSQQAINQAKFVIVGSGFFGLTIAERIANDLQEKVVVIEKRDELGGNAYSYFDSGIEVHKYGSHLFHTSNIKVWEYINKFSKFTEYKHKVFTNSENQIYSLPINLHTISQVAGKDLSPEAAMQWINNQINELESNQGLSFQDLAISKIGRSLYTKFFEGYTQKQWQTKPSDLPGEIFSRLPVRLNFNSDYFTDDFQGLPMNGYGKLFEAMVSHPCIEILTNLDFFRIRDRISSDKIIIYTGPIDEFFEYKFGVLGWRTVDLELSHLDVNDFQGCSVKNYSDLSVPYTRIHEFKHLHPERKDVFLNNKTIIAHEYSRFAQIGDEPYYPINTSQNQMILNQYRELIKLQKNVYFGGRLGTYKYLDMHMAIASALALYERIKDRKKFP